MIIATAGHIDHGKTSLVKALTGIDTDRLPEEKKRGLSIDLGFAYTPCASGVLGFVDVPGHERFVRNMIAGVTAIDCALLVVACDDGPMPQTREHLAILDLLGVKNGVVALTKIDRVAPERIAQARADITRLLRNTCFAGSAVFPVAAPTGEGIADLRAWFDQAAIMINQASISGHFRMAIDRAFIIDGAGLVVTGAVSSGEVNVDDRLMLAPAGVEVRVRGVHAQNRKAQKGRAGERCAINIIAPRLTVENVHRGDWLLAADIHAPTLRFDARIRILDSETHALRHWSPAHVHAGAADLSARVAVLEGGSIAPGGDGLAQIVLQNPASLLFGERIILRDQSGQRTIGGGYVIDPLAPAQGRARPQRLALLKALDQADPASALVDALQAAPMGLRFGGFLSARNLPARNLPARSLPAAESKALREAVAEIKIAGEGQESIGFSAAHWSALLSQLRDILARRAGADTISRPALQKAMGARLPAVAMDALLQALLATREIIHESGQYRMRGASVQLDPKDAALWSKLEILLDSCRPPSLAELTAELKSDQRSIERMLQKTARMGLAVQIAPNRYYLPARLRELGKIAESVAKENPGGLVSIRAFRDKSGVGRNLCVEALEFFDRLGFTGRAGEHRRIVKVIDDVKWVRRGG